MSQRRVTVGLRTCGCLFASAACPTIRSLPGVRRSWGRGALTWYVRPDGTPHPEMPHTLTDAAAAFVRAAGAALETAMAFAGQRAELDRTQPVSPPDHVCVPRRDLKQPGVVAGFEIRWAEQVVRGLPSGRVALVAPGAGFLTDEPIHNARVRDRVVWALDERGEPYDSQRSDTGELPGGIHIAAWLFGRAEAAFEALLASMQKAPGRSPGAAF